MKVPTVNPKSAFAGSSADTDQQAATPLLKHLQNWRAYLEITKPKVVYLLVFTALVGMVLAVPGMVPLQETIFGLLGIGLAAASAAAINHVIDQRTDAIMKRTQARPIPQGQLTTRQCLIFAGLIGVIAMLMLYFLVNPLTALLTFLSLIGYAVVYTVYLKRATPQNIVIGGAAGAMPPVLGWTAITGQVTADHTIRMFDNKLEKQPIKTFVFSIQYLMWLFAFMLVDHYLPHFINLTT